MSLTPDGVNTFYSTALLAIPIAQASVILSGDRLLHRPRRGDHHLLQTGYKLAAGYFIVTTGAGEAAAVLGVSGVRSQLIFNITENGMVSGYVSLALYMIVAFLLTPPADD